MRITYQQLAAMSAMELLEIQDTAEYDKWHYLETLLAKAPGDYMREMKGVLDARRYDSIQWLAVWCKSSYDAAIYPDLERNLVELKEGYLPRKPDVDSEKAVKQRRTHEFVYSNHSSDSNMSYLYDYSQRFRDWWKQLYKSRMTRTGQVIAVYYFAPFRQKYMGVPQLDSFHVLLDCGWDVRQIFLSYAAQNNSYSPPLDPEAVAQLVREFPQEAMELTDTENWSHYINIERFDDPSANLNYNAALLVKWLHLLYRFCRWTDRTPLEAGLRHRRKNVRQLCSELMEELDKPVNELELYTRALGQLGLHGTAASYVPTPKGEKQRKKSLVSAWLCRHSWKREAFAQAFLLGLGAEVAPMLLWGIYRDDEMALPFRVFGGTPVDLQGNPVQHQTADLVRLVHPMELESEVLKAWRKYFRESKLKQPFSQLLPSMGQLCDGDVEGMTIRRYNGLVRDQLSIITTAGKWGLEKTEGYSNSWICYHLINPVQGLGAQLCVERIWGGPEYNQEMRVFGDACFYRLPEAGFRFGELVPEGYRLHPDEVPLYFSSSIISIFDAVTGWKAK